MGWMAMMGWLRTQVAGLNGRGVLGSIREKGQHLLEKLVNHFFPTNSSGNNMSRG